MATALHDKMKSAGSKRRKQIEVRAAELIAEEMSLNEMDFVKRGRPRKNRD